jgi:hypothetical protein
MIFIFAAGLMLLVWGLTMVLTSAFKKRFLWGMGLLLLPVLVPVYAKFHWLEPRARNGFLVAIIGTLVIIAAVYGGAAYEIGEIAETVPDKRVQAQVTKLAQQVPTAGPSKEPLPNEAEAAKIHFPEGEYYDPLSRYEEYAAVDVEPLPSRDSIILNYPEASNYQYQPRKIGFDELEQYLGKPLKLTTKECQINEGKLIETNRKSLLLEIPYEDGFVAFEYKLSNIDTLIVFDLVEKTPPLKAAIQVEPASVEALADKPDTAGIPDGEATPPEEAHANKPDTAGIPHGEAIPPEEALANKPDTAGIPHGEATPPEEALADKPDTAGIPDGEATPPEEALADKPDTIGIPDGEATPPMGALTDKPDTAGIPDGEVAPPEEAPAKTSVATVPTPGNNDTLQQSATNQGTVLQMPYASQHDMPDQSGHQPEGTSMDPEVTKIRGQNEQ